MPTIELTEQEYNELKLLATVAWEYGHGQATEVDFDIATHTPTCSRFFEAGFRIWGDFDSFMADMDDQHRSTEEEG